MRSELSSNGSGKTTRPSTRSNPGWTQMGGNLLSGERSPSRTFFRELNHIHPVEDCFGEGAETSTRGACAPQKRIVALISLSPVPTKPCPASRQYAHHLSTPARRSRRHASSRRNIDAASRRWPDRQPLPDRKPPHRRTCLPG